MKQKATHASNPRHYKNLQKDNSFYDLTRGRYIVLVKDRTLDDYVILRTTWNLLIAERIVVKRLAIGPLGR